MNLFTITIKGNHFRNFVRRLLNRVFILAFSLYVRFQDSLKSWILRCGLRIPGIGFWIPSKWTWIQYSSSKRMIDLECGFQIPGFRIPQTKFSRISESRGIPVGCETSFTGLISSVSFQYSVLYFLLFYSLSLGYIVNETRCYACTIL